MPKKIKIYGALKAETEDEVVATTADIADPNDSSKKLNTMLDEKIDKTGVKTINSESILGEGNILIEMPVASDEDIDSLFEEPEEAGE